MANIKVSELPIATTFESDDYSMIVQSGENKKISKPNMLKDVISDLTATTSFNNSDYALLYQNDASKKILGANLKNSIIETGSNANGDYIKFHDGTMICYGKYTGTINITSTAGSLYYGSATLTYPQTFIAVPTVVPAISQAQGLIWFGFGNTGTLTTSQIQIRAISGNSVSNASITFYYIAMGKWK